MAEPITDLSDQGWTDLKDADREILQELAGERDGIDARGANEALAAALLAFDGRVDEVPDDYREEYADEIDDAQDAAIEEMVEGEAEPDEETDDEPEEPEEPEADEPDEYGTQVAETARGASFIIEAGRLQAWLDHVDTMVEEAKVNLNDDGIYTRAVDPANVGMVEAGLDRHAFESFDVPTEALIGIGIGSVLPVVRSADVDDLISIEFDAERRNLVFRWGGHEFTITLIDPDSIRKRPDLPDLDLPVELEFYEARDFDQALQFADRVSDHVSFAAEDRTFYTVAEGDTDDYTGSFEDGEEVSFTALPRDERVYSLFSMDYLNDIRKAWDKDIPIEIDLGNEFPVELRTDIRADDQKVGDVKYLLAPRIQSE